MKVIKNSFIPWGYADYINLFGVIFTKRDNIKLSKQVINHESIHTLQMKYLLYIPFYILYVIEWLFKIPVAMFINQSKYGLLQYAYRSISFEQMAYYNDKNYDYLETANPYEWVKYIFKMYEIDRRNS